MKTTEYTWKGSDGIRFYGRSWSAEEGKPKAVICIIHGLGEHCSRYDHVAEYFTSNGYAVAGMDHRGHGKTSGKRGHTPSYDTLMDDMSLFFKQVEEWFPGIPKIMYGQSMGGNFVVNYLLRKKDKFQAAIASSPLLKLAFDPPAIKLALGNIMKHIYPGFTENTDLETAAISRDPVIVKAYENDELIHDKITTALFFGNMDAAKWAIENAEKLDTKLLLMHGDADRLTHPDGSRDFAANSPDHATLKIWPGAYHEIHNEPERMDALNFVKAWIEE